MVDTSNSKLAVQSIADLPIIGRRVTLQKATLEDAPFLAECYNQIEFRRLYRLSFTQPVSNEVFERELATQKPTLLNTLKKIEWIIYRKQNEHTESLPIGLVSLVDINLIHKTAEFQIGIAQSKDKLVGIAAEASFLAMEFAFKILALHKLYSYVYGFNQHSQRSTLSLGFTQEGLLRKQYWDPIEQKHINLFFNGFLALEFWNNARIAKLSFRLIGRDITSRSLTSQSPCVQVNTYSKKELATMTALFKESIARNQQPNANDKDVH